MRQWWSAAALLLVGAAGHCQAFTPAARSTRTCTPASTRAERSNGLACRALKEPQSEEELRSAIATKNEDLSRMDKDRLQSFAAADEEFLAELLKERSYLSIVTEKAVETVDSLLTAGKGGDANAPATGIKPKVIVLGAGWASHAFLKGIDTDMYDVTVVSPRNFFLMTPMLAASAVGTVEFRSITEPIRNVNLGANYIEATCTAIDSDSQEIVCENVVCEGTSCTIEDFRLPYDHLILAVGATSNTFGIPGVREHCIFMKQVTDADKLRRAIGNCFERANLPTLSDEQKQAVLTFVVVGGGPTGVELTAELRDFIEQDVPRFYPNLVKFVRIKLVEASDRVLMAFDEELQAKALRDLTERSTTLISQGFIKEEMTEVMLNVGVKEITDTTISLSTGETMPYGLCVWAAGNGPLPLVVVAIDQISEQKEKAGWGRGRLVTDDWLRVKGAKGVYAIGDCGVVDQRPLPQTAQVAAQQGSFLARLFSRGYNLNAPVPEKTGGAKALSEQLGLSSDKSGKFAKGFSFMNLGILAYTGGGNALAQVQVDNQRVKGTGAAGFFLWRSVYMSKQVSWRNRILVAIDWTKARLFGRDIVRF
eukprot:TRINITY_DN22835_c0_g1_i1.p1 TRINITY_DN22835_c0_g1~~TRINITY_DN22835_c0_g1_i1.p1  ORF type:complete len:594 (+),score=175.20 TRINITY_DN22835_c0_g1_i1:66-1847(+)